MRNIENINKIKKGNKIKKEFNILRFANKVMLICIILISVVWSVLAKINISIGEKEEALEKLDGVETVLNTPKKEEINFLMAGTNQMLTDSIMYCKYNTVTNKLYIMSIPRDTYVTNKYCIGHKINAIYRGINLDPFIAQIEEILQVKMDYYAIYDTKVVREVVDSVGGVEVYVPQDMRYTSTEQKLYINLKKGTQVLNGQKAEWFVRYRSGYSNADLGRVEAQRAFVKAFLETLIKPKNIANISKIADIATKNTETNITVREMLKYVDELKELKVDEITSVTMPNTLAMIDKLSYVKADLTATRKIIHEDWKDSSAGE